MVEKPRFFRRLKTIKSVKGYKVFLVVRLEALKMQHMKMTDQWAGHEILQDMKLQDIQRQSRKLAQKRQTSEYK